MYLSIEHLSKRFGAVNALEDASLSVSGGEIRGLFGGNGSGKSTLVKITGGWVKKDSGNIIINDKPVDFTSPHTAKSLGVVSTSQELSLFDNLSVAENIMICSLPKRAGIFTNRDLVKSQANQVLERIGLSGKGKCLVKELPPNEQYMVEFGKALVQNPKILLIDEITSALYRDDVQTVECILNDLKAQGTAILFITHRINELKNICDTVTVMRNGRTIETVDADSKTEEEMLSLMVGKNIDNQYHGHHFTMSKQEIPRLKVNDLKIPAYGVSMPFEIYPGEIIGVAGLQGNGQSEFVRALHGMVTPISLQIDGHDVHIKNTVDAVREGFAFIPGNREREGVFNEQHIRGNFSVVKELTKKQEVGNIRESLKQFNVKYDTPVQLLTTLSGGNQQKVVVGRWLCTKPKLILADDPTKGIDVQARSELHKMFAELASQGASIIMVSSDDDELVLLTSLSEHSRVIVMYEGRIVKTLRGEQISRDNIVAASVPKTGDRNEL